MNEKELADLIKQRQNAWRSIDKDIREIGIEYAKRAMLKRLENNSSPEEAVKAFFEAYDHFLDDILPVFTREEQSRIPRGWAR